MNNEIEEYQAIVEFRIAIGKNFSVTIRAWQMDRKWQWNVYANIFETHKLFNDPKSAIDKLPFHGGCTYDKIKEEGPTGGNKYDKSESYKTLVLGSDYMHLHDNYDNWSSPLEMIPYSILLDAKELATELEK